MDIITMIGISLLVTGIVVCTTFLTVGIACWYIEKHYR